jgi:hypothetical protein
MSKEDLLEEFKMVEYRMRAEGFHYCFKSYSSFKEVEDSEFHRLRLDYLKVSDELEKYVQKRINDLEKEISENDFS